MKDSHNNDFFKSPSSAPQKKVKLYMEYPCFHPFIFSMSVTQSLISYGMSEKLMDQLTPFTCLKSAPFGMQVHWLIMRKTAKSFFIMKMAFWKL